MLVLKTGEAISSVEAVHGDFDVMFARALGCDVDHFLVVRPDLDEPLPPSPRSYQGVLVTGSAASVTTGAPWMLRCARWLVSAADAGAIILGVCFGHQLVAEAFGGRVERSPKGREMGAVSVFLGAEGSKDPLFDGLPDRLVVQQTHEDVVVSPPAEAISLAKSEHSDHQALAISSNVRTVQFHPEFDAAISRGYIDAREGALRGDALALGRDPDDHLAGMRASMRDSDHGSRVLSNWQRLFVERSSHTLEEAGAHGLDASDTLSNKRRA